MKASEPRFSCASRAFGLGVSPRRTGSRPDRRGTAVAAELRSDSLIRTVPLELPAYAFADAGGAEQLREIQLNVPLRQMRPSPTAEQGVPRVRQIEVTIVDVAGVTSLRLSSLRSTSPLSLIAAFSLLEYRSAAQVDRRPVRRSRTDAIAARTAYDPVDGGRLRHRHLQRQGRPRIGPRRGP